MSYLNIGQTWERSKYAAARPPSVGFLPDENPVQRRSLADHRPYRHGGELEKELEMI
jgi:hypothetical protein